MPLVIFDIDGTLTRTTGLDDECFIRAFDETLGIRGFDPDWASYPQATDSGLAREIPRRTIGRELTPAEQAALHDRFIELMTGVARREPGRFAPVAGAASMLDHLRRRRGADDSWGLALATGSWRASAALKLATAGLPVADVPLAHADDAPQRERIVLTAAARAMAGESAADAAPHERTLADARERFGGVLYVGDGVWDARAAAALGIGFVGLRADGQETRLRALGVTRILRDYADLARALAAIAEAAAEHAGGVMNAGGGAGPAS